MRQQYIRMRSTPATGLAGRTMWHPRFLQFPSRMQMEGLGEGSSFSQNVVTLAAIFAAGYFLGQRMAEKQKG